MCDVRVRSQAAAAIIHCILYALAAAFGMPRCLPRAQLLPHYSSEIESDNNLLVELCVVDRHQAPRTCEFTVCVALRSIHSNITNEAAVSSFMVIGPLSTCARGQLVSPIY